MKIDNSGAMSAYVGQSKLAKRDVTTQPASSNASSEDSVDINPLASSISALASQADTSPSFDSAKVESIKAAITAGTFTINPDKIADNLISSTQALLSQ